jgi:SAM-dependent methyltransferase
MNACPLCAGALETAFVYDARPEGETEFGIAAGDYRRSYAQCATCGLYVADLGALDLDELYAGAYVDATYSGDGMRATFDRIMALPPERSDNAGRVARVVEWLSGSGADATVLDVGSGLGVFPAALRRAGYGTVVALDPDARAVEHARAAAGVQAVRGDFMESAGLGLGRFALVTLNKVLEHVPDPVAMLARVHDHLAPGGAVYVELPDGEAAARDPDGQDREEFFIEHLHVFSPPSLALLARRAGFDVQRLERLREPSGKYMVYAFLTAAAGDRGHTP